MLQINYMHFRRNFYPLIIKILNGVNRPFRFNFLTDQSQPFDAIGNYLFENAKFEYSIQVFPRHDNYRHKIQWCYDNCEDYHCKLDEDVFFNHHIWEYCIDTLDVLKDSNTLFMSPWLMNGVPTADLAAPAFLDRGALEILYNIYLNTNINHEGNTICPNCPQEIQGDYLALNNHTYKASQWDAAKFYETVTKIRHYYRGINPARINFEATEFLNNWVIDNIDKFCDKNDYYLQFMYDYPYFCNSVYFMHKDKLQNIAKMTHEHGFDEVPMNLYLKENNMPMIFVGNTVGVHTLYSNASYLSVHENPHANPNGEAWELDYYKRLNETYDIYCASGKYSRQKS